MAFKTFVPAFEAKVGNWIYYNCLMSYAQVAREINFAHELGGNKDLSTLIQRGVGSRTAQITEYLLTNENRFLGAMVVAAWGGNPNYIHLEMDPEAEGQAVLDGIDLNFGVLTFDGTQQFFALDGQHRLRAIKDALKKKPELGSEDICVIVVPHFDTDDGRRRTRRLFTNINRNAKETTLAENIALDEDDSFAILARRLVDEHKFFSEDKVVTVFSKMGEEGDITLASKAISPSSPAFTSLGTLYDIAKEIGFDLPCTEEKTKQRVSDEVLDESYELLSKRLDEVLEACGQVRTRYLKCTSAKELRAPKGREGAGHPMMRPIIQIRVARAIRTILEDGSIAWSDLMARLAALDWQLSAAPFSAVWVASDEAGKGKMVTGKDNGDLLRDLLLIHLAPKSKVQITRTVKNYSVITRTNYPVSPETLFPLIPTGETTD